MKYSFEKVDFDKKKLADDQNHSKLPSGQRVNSYFCILIFQSVKSSDVTKTPSGQTTPKPTSANTRLGNVGSSRLSPTSIASATLNNTTPAQNSTNHSQNGHNNNENAKPNVPDNGGCVLNVYVVLLITAVIALLEA